MKFYIASRFHNKEKIREIYKTLIAKGHQISADWTLHKRIVPYNENLEIASQYTQEDINGAKDCDVFILISDEAGTGMHTELGVAISSHILSDSPKIYVIGEFISNSMFYFHPSVKRMNNIQEVFDDLGI